MNIRRVIAATASVAMLAGSMLFGASASVAAEGDPPNAPGIEGQDYLIPSGEEVAATNGARAWVADCEVNDAAGTFPLQTADGEMQGRYYLCQVGFVIEEGHQAGQMYSVNGSDVAATATFQSLGVPFVPPGGVECEPDALLPSYAGAHGGSGEIGNPGEIDQGAYAAGLTIGFQDATCKTVRTAEPEPVEEPTPAEQEPVVDPEPTEQPVLPVLAERSVPVIGTCGFIALPSGLDPNELSEVMTNATSIPVVSDGVKVTAYVTRKSYTADLGSGPFEQNQIDLYIIPELPYDEVSVQGKTGWTNGEAPQLDELFRSRNYTMDLGALLATPELTRAGATGITFTEDGIAPGVGVSIGDDLTLSSTLLQFFGIQNGNQDRPVINALIAPMPLPAECEVPVIEEPQVPVEEESVPTPPTISEPSVEPKPVTPRAVPEAVRTGVGPANASGVVPPTALAEWSDLTIRELLDLLYSAKSDVAPVLTLSEPKPMPFSNVLEPTSFDDLWVIDDAENGYTADGPQYFLAHTHTQGGAVGNAVNEAGLTPGTMIEVAGVRYDVTEVSTIAKPDIGTLPIWQSNDPKDAYLVVCLWNNGSLATHNLVIELHRS